MMEYSSVLPRFYLLTRASIRYGVAAYRALIGICSRVRSSRIPFIEKRKWEQAPTQKEVCLMKHIFKNALLLLTIAVLFSANVQAQELQVNSSTGETQEQFAARTK